MDNPQTKERAREAAIQMAKAMHKVVDAFRDLLLAWLDLRPEIPQVARIAEDDKPVYSLGASQRACTVLLNEGIRTVGDFKRMTVESVRALKVRAHNCGDVTVNELLAIREQLKTMPEARDS